jgi:hypothetical protein
MAVARSFGDIPHGAVFEIEASALYLLSGPTVPQTARDAAVKEAGNGEAKITKKRANELIEEARAKAFNNAVAEYLEDS